MHYYKLSLLKRKLSPLTYFHQQSIQIGSIVEVFFQEKITYGVIIEEVPKPSFTCKQISNTTNFYYSEHQRELASFISNYYVSSLGKALALFTPFSKEKSHTTQPCTCKKNITLSSFQQKAKKELDKYSQALLFGDTGSGKSEVYMSIMEDILQNGQNVIFLMPEISLTPQMKKRLTEHFGSLVAIWHSKITKKKKQEIQEGIKKGDIRIVAGARSALFLPLKNIGLIIVDEEHDDSYKASNSPRYNAKDLSLMYGKIIKCKVVLGSATPSLTTFHKIPHVRLKQTYFSTNKQFIYENAHNEVTPLMLKSIQDTLKTNKQVIVFVPTRANFKYLTCKECGAHIECPYCSISMSLHKNYNALRCHYCHFSMKIPTTCHECGSSMIESHRIGTVEVASTLQDNFKDKNIAIFDRDAINTHKKLNSILKDFNDKNIDVLVGTQMLSKGHDYHDVALCVIMGIDASLTMADFRAQEKTLALALQIAGRSGRKENGKVFIQTQNREFFEKYIQNYDAFLKDELEFRKDLYPPFKKLLRILISHKNENTCQNITKELVSHIQLLNLQVEIIGSGKSNIQKIANKYRYHILLRSNSAKALIQTALTCKRSFVEIDMDPLSFS